MARNARSSPYALRASRRGAALVSAIAILLAVGVMSACFLNMASTNLIVQTGELDRQRAQAAAEAGLQLALWYAGNDDDCQNSLALAISKKDTSLSSDPLIQLSGALLNASFTADVWPGATAVRIRARGISGPAYFDRWADVPYTVASKK